jgi:hypothetical protein
MCTRFFFNAWLLAGLCAICTTAFAADKQTQFRVPYKVDAGNHIVVRVKVNGEGPHWFVVDTGAPGFVLSPAMAARLGIKGDADRWGITPRVEIEGGIVLENVRTAIVPGIPDGVGLIGYTVLAQFRIEFDINRDTMLWTKKDWNPPRPLTRRELGIKEPLAFGGAGGGGAAGGAAPAAYIGIQADPSASPVRIMSVVPNGPAQAAGVQAGDLVKEINGQEIGSPQELMQLLAASKPGDQLKFTIERNGKQQQLAVTAADRARANIPAAGGGGGMGGLAGLTQGLTPQGAPTGYVGVEFDYVAPPCKIAAVHKGSPAESAGLKAGDVVTQFNGRAVSSPDDVARASAAVRGGAEVTFIVERNGQSQTITVKAAHGF